MLLLLFTFTNAVIFPKKGVCICFTNRKICCTNEETEAQGDSDSSLVTPSSNGRRRIPPGQGSRACVLGDCVPSLCRESWASVSHGPELKSGLCRLWAVGAPDFASGSPTAGTAAGLPSSEICGTLVKLGVSLLPPDKAPLCQSLAV